MKQYQDLLAHLLENGTRKADRTGTGTLSVLGYQMRFDLSEGFPLVTTKKLHLRSIIHELLWFIRGETNVKSLQAEGVTIWDEWARENGDLGPIYGKQWRSWTRVKRCHDGGYYREGIDQLKDIVERIKTHPDCRRLIVSAWNPADLPDMALAPCHCLFQFYTRPLAAFERYELLRQRDNPDRMDPIFWISDIAERHAALTAAGIPERALSCQLYQRSCDTFLGVPFNIASYALLVHMVARHVGMVPGEFVWTGGDVHLYLNHIEQAKLQLTREPYPLPKLVINEEATDLFRMRYKDFSIVDYQAHPAIAAPISV